MEWWEYLLIAVIVAGIALPIVYRTKREQEKNSAPSNRGPAGSGGRG